MTEGILSRDDVRKATNELRIHINTWAEEHECACEIQKRMEDILKQLSDDCLSGDDSFIETWKPGEPNFSYGVESIEIDGVEPPTACYEDVDSFTTVAALTNVTRTIVYVRAKKGA